MTNYETILAALSCWHSTRENRVFSITAIKQIVSVKFLEAVAIKKRLEREGLVVDGGVVKQDVEQLTLF